MRPNRAVRAALNVTVPPMALRVLRDTKNSHQGHFTSSQQQSITQE